MRVEDGKRFEKDVVMYNKAKNGMPVDESESDSEEIK